MTCSIQIGDIENQRANEVIELHHPDLILNN